MFPALGEMARHFLGLYVLIVLALTTISWGQDRLLQAYGNQDSADDKSLSIATAVLKERLRGLPEGEWQRTVTALGNASGADMELFTTGDIAGRETLAKLARGATARMQASGRESWALKQLDEDHVLALKSVEPDGRRGLLEWTLTLLFYAAMALVIMIWLWPLTRDLRSLESTTARFGNRNWRFDVGIKPRSQIYPLAETFRKMAARIDALIASHKDMSNAVSHEIKTPLARMQFEIELAQRSERMTEVKDALSHIKVDVAAINDLVTAAMRYAILERADMTLNMGAHDFSALIPAITEAVKRDSRPDIRMTADIQDGAGSVVCDVHLLESVLKNLLYNAARYARSEVRVAFHIRGGMNQLIVEDDGPGIPEADRKRVFESFVQLHRSGEAKSGFGLGLAIVKRAIEWHGGAVDVTTSPLGGARFSARWPAREDPPR